MRILVLSFAIAACGTTKPAVFPADTQTFEMTASGGDVAAPAAGSTCIGSDPATFTYVLATRALSWHACTDPNRDQVFTFVDGAATLSSAQDGQLVTALRALAPMNLPPNEGWGSNAHLTFVFDVPNRQPEMYADAICLDGESDVENAVYGAAQL